MTKALRKKTTDKNKLAIRRLVNGQYYYLNQLQEVLGLKDGKAEVLLGHIMGECFENNLSFGLRSYPEVTPSGIPAKLIINRYPENDSFEEQVKKVADIIKDLYDKHRRYISTLSGLLTLDIDNAWEVNNIISSIIKQLGDKKDIEHLGEFLIELDSKLKEEAPSSELGYPLEIYKWRRNEEQNGSFEKQVDKVANIIQNLCSRDHRYKSALSGLLALNPEHTWEAGTLKVSITSKFEGNKDIEHLGEFLIELDSKLKEEVPESEIGYPLEIYKNQLISSDECFELIPREFMLKLILATEGLETSEVDLTDQEYHKKFGHKTWSNYYSKVINAAVDKANKFKLDNIHYHLYDILAALYLPFLAIHIGDLHDILGDYDEFEHYRARLKSARACQKSYQYKQITNDRGAYIQNFVEETRTTKHPLHKECWINSKPNKSKIAKHLFTHLREIRSRNSAKWRLPKEKQLQRMVSEEIKSYENRIIAGV